MSQVIDIEILDDGRIKVDTGDMSGPNHRDADELLKTIDYVCGGEVEIKQKKGHHHHGHSHDHSHGHSH